MPIHDWSKADPGYFHHFHQYWSTTLCTALNAGVLPRGFFALIEQSAIGGYPDVLTLRGGNPTPDGPTPRPGVAVADAPPKVRFVSRVESEKQAYARKANRVVVRGRGDHIVASLEIISPGNKASRAAIDKLIAKSARHLARGVNLLIVDLFPPTARDPQGLHPLIWALADDEAESFVLPPDKPLTLAAYVSGLEPTAYIEPVAVGDTLPDMPIFLDPETYVPAPLERTYQETWNLCPREFRERVERGPQG